MNICVYGASSNKIDNVYIEKCEELGEKLAKRGHKLVFGGGNGGVMGAAARGAAKVGGEIIGISPTFFKVDGILFKDCTEFVYTETMRQRKEILENRSDAYVVAPGGIGTFDEFFEIYTLKQLGRHAKALVIYNINGYYDDMIKMLQKTVKQDFMAEKSLELFEVFDNADEMLSYIENYKGELVSLSEVKHVGVK